MARANMVNSHVYFIDCGLEKTYGGLPFTSGYIFSNMFSFLPKSGTDATVGKPSPLYSVNHFILFF
jgi:hypothetical protein